MEEVLTRRFSHGMREVKELEEKGGDLNLGSFTRFPDPVSYTHLISSHESWLPMKDSNQLPAFI